MASVNETESEELKKIKSEIRSLLISRPGKTVLLNVFLKDYKQTLGRELPFRNFNFQSPFLFLSSLSDVVKVTEGHDGLRLTAVVSELSSHIQDLVKAQKPPKSKYSHYRRPPPAPLWRPPQAVPRPTNMAAYYNPPQALLNVQPVSYAYGMTPWISHPGPYYSPTVPPAPLFTGPLVQRFFTPGPAPPANYGAQNLIQDSQEPPAKGRPLTIETDVKNVRENQSTAEKSGENTSAVLNSAATKGNASDLIEASNGSKNDGKTIPDGIESPQFASSLVCTLVDKPAIPGPTVQASSGSRNDSKTVPDDIESPEFGSSLVCRFVDEPVIPWPTVQASSSSRNDSKAVPDDIESPEFGSSPIFRLVDKPTIPGPTVPDDLSGFDRDLVKSICSRSLMAEMSIGLNDSKLFHATPGSVARSESTVFSDIENDYSGSVERHDRETPLKIENPSAGLSNSVKSKISSLLEKYPHGISTAVFLKEYQRAHSEVLGVASSGYSSLKELILKNEQVFSFEKSKSQDDWLLHDARLKPKKRQSVDAGKKWIPKQVLDNLATLARDRPDGINASEILELYKSKFGVDVHPESLGFKNVTAFLTQCDSVCLRMYGDLGVVYRKGWTPALASQTPADALIEEPALPVDGMKHIWRNYFEDYECDPLFRYKPPLIPEEKYVRVKLVDVHSPALLWLHFVDDVKNLSEMMDELSDFYEKEEANYVLPEEFVLPGLAVAALFKDSWHRGIILSVVSSSRVQVTYVDYGTTDVIPVEWLRKLDRKFAQHHQCAIRASLFCLGPTKGDEWSLDSCEFIFNHWSERIIFAELCSIDYKESFVEVILYETSPDFEININDLLVERKFARYLVKPVSSSPSSVLNESAALKFCQLLPWWFSCSETSDYDGKTCVKNLLCCTSGDVEPIEFGSLPCCKAHGFQTFFRANPEAMARKWRAAVKLEQKRIMSNLMRLLEDLLRDLRWTEMFASLKDFCNEHSESAIINNPPVEKKVTKELNGDAEVFVPRLKERFQNGPTPPFGSTSREPNSEPKLSRSRLVPIPKHKTPYIPEVIKYLPIRVACCELTLIFYDEKYRLSLSQLLQIVRLIPYELSKVRLVRKELQLDKIVVTADTHPALFEDLVNLNLARPDQIEELILVLLDDAPTIIQAVDPISDYHDTFRCLSLQVKQIDCWIGPDTNVRPAQK